MDPDRTRCNRYLWGGCICPLLRKPCQSTLRREDPGEAGNWLDEDARTARQIGNTDEYRERIGKNLIGEVK